MCVCVCVREREREIVWEAHVGALCVGGWVGKGRRLDEILPGQRVLCSLESTSLSLFSLAIVSMKRFSVVDAIGGDEG